MLPTFRKLSRCSSTSNSCCRKGCTISSSSNNANSSSNNLSGSSVEAIPGALVSQYNQHKLRAQEQQDFSSQQQQQKQWEPVGDAEPEFRYALESPVGDVLAWGVAKDGGHKYTSGSYIRLGIFNQGSDHRLQNLQNYRGEVGKSEHSF